MYFQFFSTFFQFFQHIFSGFLYIYIFFWYVLSYIYLIVFHKPTTILTCSTAVAEPAEGTLVLVTVLALARPLVATGAVGTGCVELTGAASRVTCPHVIVHVLRDEG